jgi:hypothetical protein
LAERRFPPPWTVEDIGGSFVVKASNDRPLVFIYLPHSRLSVFRHLQPHGIIAAFS